jgi:chromosome segregation ATPase
MVFPPIRRLRLALSERNTWLLAREQRILQLERQLERTQARVSERDDWLLLREQRIVQLETEIEQAQEIVRDREHAVHEREQKIALLEAEVQELSSVGPGAALQLELDQRSALIRQREARIKSLEIENQSQDA